MDWILHGNCAILFGFLKAASTQSRNQTVCYCGKVGILNLQNLECCFLIYLLFKNRAKQDFLVFSVKIILLFFFNSLIVKIRVKQGMLYFIRSDILIFLLAKKLYYYFLTLLKSRKAILCDLLLIYLTLF